MARGIIRAVLQVYDSLKKSEKMSESELAHFNPQQGAQLLYELRFIPVTARPPAALYMVERDMNPNVCPGLHPVPPLFVEDGHHLGHFQLLYLLRSLPALLLPFTG